MNRPLLAEDRLVPLSEVLHHAGNGLTPARLAAQMLAEVLDIICAIEAPDELLGLAHRHALEIIDAIDATMARLDALAREDRYEDRENH